MAGLFLVAVGYLLVWGYRNVLLTPRSARPKASKPGSTVPAKPGVPVATAVARSPYEVLCVGVDATPEQLRRAYHEQIRKHHPDRVAGGSLDERRAAERRTAELNAAYQLVCPK